MAEALTLKKSFLNWKGEIKMYAVGVDIGGTAIKIGVLDEQGRMTA